MSKIEISKPVVSALAKFAERNNVPASAVVRAGQHLEKLGAIIA